MIKALNIKACLLKTIYTFIDALLSLETKSGVDAETLFFLMGETRPHTNCFVGEPVMNWILARNLEASSSRGFMNMLNALKLEYVSILTENGLLEKLISYLVTVAGASSLPLDGGLQNQVAQDMRIPLWK